MLVDRTVNFDPIFSSAFYCRYPFPSTELTCTCTVYLYLRQSTCCLENLLLDKKAYDLHIFFTFLLFDLLLDWLFVVRHFGYDRV